MVDKIANPNAAASAYANMAKMVGANASESQATGAPSFGDFMKDVAVSSLNTMRNSETMSAKAVTGEASLPDVVQAVNAAEMTISTVVAVRDRLIGAYQELMRSQI
jgi:flagellar hook-basal body complex protein FliE